MHFLETYANSKKRIGFFIGFGLALLIQYGAFEIFHELFNHRIRPGIGAFLLPFAGGFIFASSTSYESIKYFIKEIKMGRRVRLIFAGGVSWTILVAGYVFLAEPLTFPRSMFPEGPSPMESAGLPEPG